MDFAELNEDFFFDSAIFKAKQGRYLAIGPFNGRAISVVFARLGSEGIAIVSMRAASPKERKLL